VGVADTIPRQGVDVRARLALVAVAAEAVLAQRVDDNEDDIGARLVGAVVQLPLRIAPPARRASSDPTSTQTRSRAREPLPPVFDSNLVMSFRSL